MKDKSAGAKKLTMLGTTIGSPYYMAPEQAQGLDTLDHRADVWAIAAIAYESLTGTVPFQGNNGPTILLSIMTKDPIAPSEAGKAKAAIPIPITVDEVMEHGFVKNPQGRISSVGELANRLGQAYGLQGDFRQWAVMPQHQLDETIKVNLPALQAKVKAEVMADPFAASAMDTAFQAAAPPPPASYPMEPAGMPKKGLPPWLLLVGIGAVCLVIGAVVMVALR